MVGTCAHASKDLETDSIRVFKENATGVRPLLVRDDTVVMDHNTDVMQSALNFLHLRNGVDLKRQVVQAGPIRDESATTLLPQGQHHLLILSKKCKSPMLLVRFTDDIEAKDPRIEVP
jgi:hypothetical protein